MKRPTFEEQCKIDEAASRKPIEHPTGALPSVVHLVKRTLTAYGIEEGSDVIFASLHHLHAVKKMEELEQEYKGYSYELISQQLE